MIGSDQVVTVAAKARVDTTFMAILGQHYINVWAESAVKRELAGVEVVLVLDVTGSMAGNNITALKYASNSFLNIMFSRISDPEYIKIGLVPFSQTVNVGRYGLGLRPDGSYYDTAFVDYPATDDYVNPPTNIQYGTKSTNWRGCILERDYPDDTNDNSSPNWGMYRYPKICSKYKNGSCSSWSNNNANTNCPASPIVPLTNSKTTLQSAINNLQTGGNTYGNVGMVWGYHVITPSFPFTEGVDLADPEWTKTVIMMTDGDNTINNTYSAYGANPGLTESDQNSRFLETCSNMKEEGITIYTVTFQSGINDTTRDYFRQCASDPGKYFNAPNNDDLTDAFEEIANQLSQLHIVR
jgi:Mg-chelatase subunit ChlD